jgi:hypothetical protein
MAWILSISATGPGLTRRSNVSDGEPKESKYEFERKKGMCY